MRPSSAFTITFLACSTALAQPAQPRGRDPWVFRCLFEDRTRMLIVAPRPNIWIAFNTSTGALQKAWQGDMVFRGKVWDFSQDSSMAKGRVLLARRDAIEGLGGFDDSEEPRWRNEGVVWKDNIAVDEKAGRVVEHTAGLTFVGEHGATTSPVFDARGMTRLFVAFDEMSRKGPVRVEISNDAGKTWGQWFDSTTHGSRDDEWQWNFRAIELEPTDTMRVRMRCTGQFEKRVRDVRVFGDEVAWWIERDGKKAPAPVEWLGHETHRLNDMAVRVKVGGVEVKERLDAETPEGAIVVRERFEIGEVPAGTVLRLSLARLTGGTRVCEPERAMQGRELVIEKAGVYEVVQRFERVEAKKEGAR